MHTWSACVIGGGVVGLTTALLAQEKGARVTLIADKFNDETTSDGAAGIFRPSTSFFVISPDITRDLIAFSYRYYENLLNEPGSGVKLISGYHVSNEESNTRNHLIEPVCPVYRPATAEELKQFPGEWKYGAFYTTLLIECRFYLPWAAKKFTSQGGQIIEAKIDKFADVKAHGDFDLIFNCTGFGAKKLCNDDKMVPISGQVFKVDAPWCDIFLYDDGDTYLIPGYLLTVGGSRHFESFRTKPCPHDGAAIWSRAKALQPRLDSAKIVRQWVGVRPYRSGGVRVQAEINDGVRIVHNYGHGGYGVTSAPGTALHAVQLALEFLISNKL